MSDCKACCSCWQPLRIMHPKDVSGEPGRLAIDPACQRLVGSTSVVWCGISKTAGISSAAPGCSAASLAASFNPPHPAVTVVHPSREAEALRSQLLGLIRNALQPLLRDRVGCWRPEGCRAQTLHGAGWHHDCRGAPPAALPCRMPDIACLRLLSCTETLSLLASRSPTAGVFWQPQSRHGTPLRAHAGRQW